MAHLLFKGEPFFVAEKIKKIKNKKRGSKSYLTEGQKVILQNKRKQKNKLPEKQKAQNSILQRLNLAYYRGSK